MALFFENITLAGKTFPRPPVATNINSGMDIKEILYWGCPSMFQNLVIWHFFFQKYWKTSDAPKSIPPLHTCSTRWSFLEQASARCPRKFHSGNQMSAWWGEHVLKSHIDNYDGDDDAVDDDGNDDVEQ